MRAFATTAVAVFLAALFQFVGGAAPALPAGFQLITYPTGQAAYNLTNFAWLDGGGLLTSGKDGTVTFVPPAGPARILTKVPAVRSRNDHGLLGFAPANDYAASGHVYVSYDKGDPTSTGYGMVEEWTASPPSDPTDFSFYRTVLDGSQATPPLAQVGGTHGIDSVVVAPDDTLFLSVGDDSANNGDPNTLRAQDLDQPYGKLFHLTTDGAGVPSNPFYSAAAPTSWRSMVYAYGLRNPFRFDLDPRSGIPHLGDVGWNAVEEIDTLSPGDNAGWPCYEGNKQTTFSSQPVCTSLYAAGSARLPIVTYPHAGSGAAVVGGVHYTGTSYPLAYEDSFFYGDYTRGEIWTLATDDAGRLTRGPETPDFAAGAGGPVAFHTGPNGDVMFADLLSGNVQRLVYTAGNRAPTAKLASTTDAATRTVTFTGSDSYDLDGDAMSYDWDFGDGTTASGETVTHTYDTDDSEYVTLTVHDQLGASGSAGATVYPANYTPQIVLDAPLPRTYAVGDVVELDATATDSEDGDLPVSWDTVLLHCPFAGSCHVHPDGTTVGPAYSEPFTDHGSDTTMLVTARATDSDGATASVTYEAKPTLRTLAIDSPVAVNVNGVTAAAAQVVAGSTVQLSAPLTSSYWRFQSWSDAGASAHSFTMPDENLTLAAHYVTAITRRYAALGGSSSFLGNATSLEYDVAGGRARNYTHGRLYWSSGTAAHEVHGSILTKYLARGGPARAGFPTTDELTVTGGRASYFTGMRIYWTSTHGAHASTGAILVRYLAAGGPDGYGLPIRDVTQVVGGAYELFTGGRSIFWSTRTEPHLVYGAIRREYALLGYQNSCLGFPTTDEYSIPTGRRNRFAGGSITYLYATRTTRSICR
jgi:glucose/arabinose dehydrogenase